MQPSVSFAFWCGKPKAAACIRCQWSSAASTTNASEDRSCANATWENFVDEPAQFAQRGRTGRGQPGQPGRRGRHAGGSPRSRRAQTSIDEHPRLPGPSDARATNQPTLIRSRTNLLTAILIAAAILAIGAIAHGVAWQLFRDSNVYVSPGQGQPITGAVRWHPTYVGTAYIDEIHGTIDTATVITEIATNNPDTAVSFVPAKDQQTYWQELGCRTRGNSFQKQLRVRVRYKPDTGTLTPA